MTSWYCTFFLFSPGGLSRLQNPSFFCSYIRDCPAVSVAIGLQGLIWPLNFWDLKPDILLSWTHEARDHAGDYHWPMTTSKSKRKSRALVYVQMCCEDNYCLPVNISTGRQMEAACPHACVYERQCVHFLMREPGCLSLRNIARERRIWPKPPLIPDQQGSSWVTCSPVCSDHTSERRERSRVIQTAGYTDNVMG